MGRRTAFSPLNQLWGCVQVTSLPEPQFPRFKKWAALTEGGETQRRWCTAQHPAVVGQRAEERPSLVLGQHPKSLRGPSYEDIIPLPIVGWLWALPA